MAWYGMVWYGNASYSYHILSFRNVSYHNVSYRIVYVLLYRQLTFMYTFLTKLKLDQKHLADTMASKTGFRLLALHNTNVYHWAIPQRGCC